MEKARKIAILIRGDDKDRHLIEEFQETIELVYKLLYFYISDDNKKQKFIIEEDLDILLFPIKNNNIMNLNKTNNIRKCISQFILEYCTDITINELNDSKKFIELIHELITETDMKNDENCIEYYIEILKVLILKSSIEIEDKIFYCLDSLKKNLLENISDLSPNERIYLRDILRLMIYMNKKLKRAENENKVKFFLPLSDIFSIFDLLKKNDLKEIMFDIVILAIDYLYLNRIFYQNDLAKNKKILRKLELILNNIDKLFPKRIIPELLYIKDDLPEETEETFSSIYINIFIGYSLLKIKHIINEISQIESIRKAINDSLTNLFKNSEYLYSILETKFINLDSMIQKSFISFFPNFKEFKEIITLYLFNCKIINYEEQLKVINEPYDTYIDGRKLATNIADFWKNVKVLFNDPTIYKTKNILPINLDIFKFIIPNLINDERRKFVISLIEFTKTSENYSKRDKNNNDEKNQPYNYLIIKILNNVFLNVIDNNCKFKNQMNFYIWALINFMKYDTEKKQFVESSESLPKNKTIISEIKFQNLILKIIRKKNLKCTDYYITLLIKFLNVYLHGLEDKLKSNFLGFLINQSESEDIFNLLNDVLQDFIARLNSKALEKNSKTVNNLNTFLIKYEKILDPYEEVIQLISNLLENNAIFKNQMKLYLRLQYNNPKSNNFIYLISKILELFSSNWKYLQYNYNTIINCIESLTRCCSGPCPENQNSLVIDTNILHIASEFLFKFIYSLDNNSDLNLTPRKKSFIKYKMIILLTKLVEGRSRNDKIFSTIYDKIDKINFEKLLTLLMKETLVQLIKEKKVHSISDLRLSDSMYQRYDNDNRTAISDYESFIILEIGTNVLILLNIFYDSLRKTNKDHNLFMKIKKLKKKIKTKLQIIKNTSFLVGFSTFLLKLIKLIQQIYRYLICHCVREKVVNLENVVTGEDAYEFYYKFTPSIEIVFKENIIKYYFKLYPMSQYLNDEMKEYFQENIDRTNTKSKLSYLFKSYYYIKEALEYRMWLEEFFKKYPILDIFFNEYIFFKDISYFLSYLINIIIIASYYRTSGESQPQQFSYSLFYIPNYKNRTIALLYTLAGIQVFLTILIFVNYILRSFSKYTYKKEKLEEKHRFQTIRFILIFIVRLLSDIEFLYNFVYLLMALIGFISQEYFFFSFHLLETTRRSDTLINVINAFSSPKKQIAVTLILFLLVEYAFTIFIFVFYQEQALDIKKNQFCNSFSRCFITVLEGTFKNPNGLINTLMKIDINTGIYLGGRFWLDNLFAIIVILLVLQMLAGIIVDNFSALRERQQVISEDKYNICFICGMHKNKINKLYGSKEGGYNQHIKLDHYYWNYLFFIMTLLKMKQKDMNEIENEIYNNYINQNFGWIPFERCEKLDKVQKKIDD